MTVLPKVKEIYFFWTAEPLVNFMTTQTPKNIQQCGLLSDIRFYSSTMLFDFKAMFTDGWNYCTGMLVVLETFSKYVFKAQAYRRNIYVLLTECTNTDLIA